MIELKNISKVYKGEGLETLALTDINLTINAGDFVAVMGPSGCGKTTLLNIMGLIDTPTCGALCIDGEDVSKFGETARLKLRRGQIGFIFQSFNLIDELTVMQNVELPLKYMGIGKGERKRMVTEVLKNLKISHRADYYPHQLSGGQQQLVAIARAIVSKPHLILADEPTGNIDSAMGTKIMETLSEVNRLQGTTIIMATHNRRDAEYAHRIINISDGKIIVTEEFV